MFTIGTVLQKSYLIYMILVHSLLFDSIQKHSKLFAFMHTTNKNIRGELFGFSKRGKNIIEQTKLDFSNFLSYTLAFIESDSMLHWKLYIRLKVIKM